MTRWPLLLIPVLLLSTGCGAFDWVESRVSRYLPQDPVEVPAATHAAATPAVETGEEKQVRRTEEPGQTLQADTPPIEVEDWPEMVDCGMG